MSQPNGCDTTYRRLSTVPILKAEWQESPQSRPFHAPARAGRRSGPIRLNERRVSGIVSAAMIDRMWVLPEAVGHGHVRPFSTFRNRSWQKQKQLFGDRATLLGAATAASIFGIGISSSWSRRRAIGANRPGDRPPPPETLQLLFGSLKSGNDNASLIPTVY